MKATINRIAIFVAALLPILALGQTFPAYLSKSQPLPEGHPKFAQQQAQAEAEETPVTPPAAVYPVCVFDEMNEQLKLSNPAFAQQLDDYINHAMPALSAGSPYKSVVEPLLTISVVVHVIHNGEPVGQGQNLSDAQILAQIAVLNEDYSSLNSQFYNTPSQWMGIAGFPNIQFCLANKKPNGTPTNGIDRQQMTVTGTSWNNNNINSTIKPAIKWDPLHYFNIYVLPIPGTTAQGGVVGFSNYPIAGQIGNNSDGVVIDYRWFGAPGFSQSGYRPLTHETGHYLGLPHPFNGGSCSLDDGIADTPNIEVSTRDLATLNCASSYPNGPMSCGNEHLYVNYMDYVTENCYTSFTAGQVNVMRAVLNGTSSGFGYGSRNELITNSPTQCSIPATDAGITRVVNPLNISCTTGQITPKVTLRNFGTNSLTSANIFYKINNNAPVSFAWQGSLFAGQNVDVSLAPFSPAGGSYTLTTWTTLPNGLADQRISNDTTVANRFTYLATAPPMYENFENETGFPTSEGIFQLNVSNDAFVWQILDSVSAYGNGSYTSVFDNYNDINGQNPFGTLDALITRHFDFTNVQDAMVRFDVAYAPYIEDIGDTLYLLIATDCSQNFNQQVFKKGGMSLATAPISTSEFTPTTAQWRNEIVDLSAYDGMSDVTVAFVNKSAFGNRLFVDNIGLGKNCNLLTATATNLQADDCSASCTGAATIQASNHNGGLHYRWEGFPTNFDQATNNQLCAGTTTVTVTDLIGCTKTVEVQIAQQQAPQLAKSSTNVTTYNGMNGTATVTVSNGTAPYGYSWSNGFQETTNANSSTATGLAKGDYTVIVTAGNGCSISTFVTVGSVCDLFQVGLTGINVSCFGGNNGQMQTSTSSGTAPLIFSWSNGQSSPNATNLTAGAYTVTVTDANGCPAMATGTVFQPTQLIVGATSTAQTINGVNNGTATANASGGVASYSYSWSNGMTGSSISGLAPGTYTVTTTDLNGCTATASTIVNSVSCASFSANLTVNNLTCFGTNNGTATAVPNGGNQPLTFAWSNGATAASVQNLAAGPISVSITDGIGCLVQLSSTVTQPAPLVTNATSTNETMPAANNGTATVNPSGGTSPYNVSWSNGATTLTINNLAPNNYAVTITDAHGCIATSQVTVQSSTCFIGLLLSSIPSTCPDLANGSATVSIQTGGNGPFGFLWSNGATTATLPNAVAGGYQVTVTDAGGCSATGQVTVESNDTTPPTIEVLSQVAIVLGPNGTATIDPNQLVSSSNDNCSMVFLEAFPETVDCSNLGSMQLTVTGTDNSGNQVIAVTIIQVVDDTPPAITCPANITVTDCGPVTYTTPTAIDNCSNPLVDLVTGYESGQIFPVGTTTVTWAANDASLNVSTCSFLVTVSSDLTVTAQTTEPSCYGASDGSISLTPSGGQSPYSFDWGPVENGNNLQAGNYPIMVTDANGCSVIDTISLSQPDELALQIDSITPATTGQSNGQIDFTVNGGTSPYTLTWLQGGSPLPNFNPAAAAAGTYQLKIVDANGCLKLSGLIVVGSVSAVDEGWLAQKITISPNPSNGIFTLKMDGVFDQVKYSVFDGTGRKILEPKLLTAGFSSEMIDLQPFTSGVFWVKIVAGEAVAWKKLVKI